MKINTVIQDCLKGKEGAWKMLVNAYSKKVFNMAYQFAGTYEEAEDLTQEVFFKIYNSLPKYNLSKNFSAWLLTLAKNHLIDSYRRTKWEKKNRDEFNEASLDSKGFVSPENHIVMKEIQNKVWEGFNHLSADIRMVIILKDIQGKKYEEIAEIMNLPIGTIKSRANRGRLQLAKILKEKKEKVDDM